MLAQLVVTLPPHVFFPNNNIEGLLIIILYIILRRKSVISIIPRRVNTSTQKPILLISFRYVFHKILHQCRRWEGFMHQFAVKSHKTRGTRRWRLNTDVVHIEDHNPHGLCKVILVKIGSDYRLGIADVGPEPVCISTQIKNFSFAVWP